MKLSVRTIALLLCTLSSHFCWAQYGQNLSKLNTEVKNFDRNNPLGETIYNVDTSINHVDFGRKKIKEPFEVVFHFKTIDQDKPYFSFKKSQITRTNMSENSGITKIELTTEGVQVTYNGKRLGPVDDYLVIHTENGSLVFWLTGEIIPKKKRNSGQHPEKVEASQSAAH